VKKGKKFTSRRSEGWRIIRIWGGEEWS